MKFIVASITLMALSASFQVNGNPLEFEAFEYDLGNETLIQDLQEFAKLIPVQQTNLLYIKYALTDHRFRETVLYAKSEKHAQLASELRNSTALKALHDYLNVTSANVSSLFNEIEQQVSVDYADLEVDPAVLVRDGRRGFSGFVREAKALLPVDEIEQLKAKKILAKGPYAGLVEKIKTEQFVVLVTKVLQEQVALKYLQETSENGLDVLALANYAATVYGLTSE